MTSKTYGNVVRGIRDIKITNSAGTVQEDLGAGSGMEISFIMDEGMLEGDDVIYAAHSMIKGAEFSLTAGTFSHAAMEIMTGLTATVTGSSPNEVTTIQFDEATRMPYFKAYGQALDDGAGDLHVLLYKCKLTSLTAFNLSNGDWRVTEASGVALDDGTNGVVKSVQHETATAVPSS